MEQQRERISLHTMTLVVTERCNQRCNYCYVTPGSDDMTLETAERALDLLFAAAREQPMVTVAFFGGEPLMVPDLLERICGMAVNKAHPNQKVRFSVTTNGTALGPKATKLLERYPFDLAVSFDGLQGQSERPLSDGRPSWPILRKNLPDLLGLAGPRPVARMTVTPSTVRHFFDDLKSVFEEGFQRIYYLPAYEQDWADLAVRTWRRQLERLTTWVSGRLGAGLPVPDLPAWQGIRARLQGVSPKHCGAGVEQVTVALDGTIYPCYRTVSDPKAQELALGNVFQGIERFDLVERLASLDPSHPRPQQASCAPCPAADRCSFFCPALGHLLASDVGLVPRQVCRLESIHTDVVAQYWERVWMADRPDRKTKLRWAAALAAAVLGAGAHTACDRNVGSGTGVDAAVTEAGVRDAGTDTGIQPGLCPQPIDGSVQDTGIQPGLCPQPIDGSVRDSGYQPGLCPQPIDGSVRDSGYQPGLCPQPIDGSTDRGNTPGLC